MASARNEAPKVVGGGVPSPPGEGSDTSTFRKRLKNVLFDRAYDWLLLALLDVSYSGALQILCWLIDWLIDWGIEKKFLGGA